MPTTRRHARALAMQALCQWDVQQDDTPDALAEFLLERVSAGKRIDYAASLVNTYWAQREDIDQRISTAALKWALSRISTVERNLMRVAVVEMLGGDVPPLVAIDEAIELGKEFGGAESPRFINGVLDKVLQELPEQLRDRH